MSEARELSGGGRWRHWASTVARKEIIDNLRDRRTLLSALLVPLMAPMVMLLMMSFISKGAQERLEKPLELAISGAERAPNLVDFLRRHGVEPQPGPEDPRAALEAEELALVLSIPQDYQERLAAARPATVELLSRGGEPSARIDRRRATSLLEGYSRQVGALRLIARGVDPGVTEALAVRVLDLSPRDSSDFQLLMIVPFALVFAAFVGGLYLVIDAIAGERERGSLEPLLLTAPARSALLIGKYAAVVLFGCFSIAFTAVAFAAMLKLMPSGGAFAVNIDLDPKTLASLVLLFLPTVFFASALQMLVATFTRSFKEAQTYLSLLPLLPGFAGFLQAFSPPEPVLWRLAIPAYGEQLLCGRLLQGESIAITDVLVNVTSNFVVAGLLLVVVVKLFERERTVFAR
ncbi:MAG: ABC transporter permease subunit [Acidobacteriota bacterium]